MVVRVSGLSKCVWKIRRNHQCGDFRLMMSGSPRSLCTYNIRFLPPENGLFDIRIYNILVFIDAFLIGYLERAIIRFVYRKIQSHEHIDNNRSATYILRKFFY